MGSQPRRSAATGRKSAGPVAHFVRERRLQQQLTQRQLAALAEVSEDRVRAIEHGERGVGLDVLSRVLDVLGLAVAVTTKSAARALASAHEGIMVQPARDSTPDAESGVG